MPGGNRFYVTTPIYYVNDAPHLGHAYTTIAADVLARWHRLLGQDVHFLTGTDEHGEKVLQAAREHGVAAQEWCDRMVRTAWQPMLAEIDASNDDFIRTTEERHVRRVQEFWARLHDAGQVYRGSYTGPYCVSCEEFKAPTELLDGGLCPVHQRVAEEREEDNYFFRLSDWGPALLEHYAAHPEFVAPASARNEVVRFVESGLSDLSITRSSFDWGVPVPWDPDHVLYVWIDALLNYVSAVGYGLDEEQFATWWPADVHLVGKDILRFHAVIWPAMLLAAGLALPRQVFAHGWLLVGGEKMSKSKLTGISPGSVISLVGTDAFRYYFLREISFGSDGAFSLESLAAVYKSELADQLGNLASRLTAMLERYREGRLPAPVDEPELAAAMSAAVSATASAMEVLDFQRASLQILDLVKTVNGYVTAREPWQLAKDPDRAADLDRVLYAAAEALRAVAVLFSPVMPRAAAALWEALGADALGPLDAQRLDGLGRWGQLPEGAATRKLAPLFPRLEDG